MVRAYAAEGWAGRFSRTRDRAWSVKRAMRPDLIIELDVAFEPLLRGTNRLARVAPDLFILEAPSEAFHKDVIPPTASAIHTNLDAMVFQQACELQTGELGALIRVEDLLAAILLIGSAPRRGRSPWSAYWRVATPTCGDSPSPPKQSKQSFSRASCPIFGCSVLRFGLNSLHQKRQLLQETL